ncbi:MAG: flagellar motor switch protein FliN [Candidatus Gastranaerophilales bacterium]|nr:flagellar motor switch protein FliN [Candidatus Gastranaerophilales bacterium]
MFDENEIENIDDNNLNGTSEEDLNADLSEKELKVNEQEEINDDEINLDDEEPVTIQPVKFSSFDSNEQTYGEPNKNLDLLLDIKLQLAVELGRCELPIKKVLELTRGSIIELDKVAGEPVELYANGKLVAHGEVVVIEDNFGLRITSITEPEERIKNL